MNILGEFEAQSLEQLDVEGEGGEPLIASDNMGGTHQVIVHSVSEMIGGDTIRLQQNMVHIVFGDGQLALDQIVELELILDGSGRAETKDPGVACGKLCLDIFHRAVTPHGVLSVVTGGFLGSFLLFTHCGKLLFGAEAGISLTLGYQLLSVNVVDMGSLALTIGAVNAVVSVNGSALVKMNTVMLQGVYQNFHSAGNFTLGIGIFDTQEEDAAALMCHALRGQALNQVAQVDKTGGGGSHTGDDCAFGNFTQGKLFLERFGGICYMGKQKISKCLIIHNKNLFSL